MADDQHAFRNEQKSSMPVHTGRSPSYAFRKGFKFILECHHLFGNGCKSKFISNISESNLNGQYALGILENLKIMTRLPLETGSPLLTTNKHASLLASKSEIGDQILHISISFDVRLITQTVLPQLQSTKTDEDRLNYKMYDVTIPWN